MKSYIIGFSLFLISMVFTVYQHDYNLHQQAMYNLKFAAEEVAAAGAQYKVKSDYGDGKFVFNQVEANKAAEYILKKQLKLDDSFLPLPNSYWKEKVTYKIEYLDDSNSSFPFLYVHESGLLTLTITDPTVIVTINAGKPIYRLPITTSNAIRVASHEWKGYR